MTKNQKWKILCIHARYESFFIFEGVGEQTYDVGVVHAPPTQSKVENIVHIGMSGGCFTVVDFTSW